MSDQGLPIGTVVRGEGHLAYTCQVFLPGDSDRPPGPEDYAFGRFVRIRAGERSIVGVIYDAQLQNPGFGRLGPRLTLGHDPTDRILTPDLLREWALLVQIAAVGAEDADGIRQGVPPWPPRVHDQVLTLTEAEVRAFHTLPGRDGIALDYLPLLLSLPSPLAPFLAQRVLRDLQALFPEERARLELLAEELRWRTQMEPLGGRGR